MQDSPYATTCLKYLGTNGLEIEMLMKRVKAEVIEMTQKQRPWVNMDPATEVYPAEKCRDATGRRACYNARRPSH